MQFNKLLIAAACASALFGCASNKDQAASQVFTGTYQTSPYKNVPADKPDPRYPDTQYINFGTNHIYRSWNWKNQTPDQHFWDQDEGGGPDQS